MGLFDSLFGTSSKASSSTNTTGVTAENQTQNQSGTANTSSNTNSQQSGSTSGTSSTTQSQATSGQTVTSTLSAEDQAALNSLIPQLTANAGAAASGNNPNANALDNIVQTLFTAGTGGNDAATDNAITASQKLAIQNFGQIGGGGQVANQTAQQIGSKGNTFSQEVGDQASNNLDTQLASIATQGKLQEQSQNLADITAAGQAATEAQSVTGAGQTASLTPLIAAIQALTGTTTTQQTTGQQTGTSSTATASQSLEDLLSSVLGTNNTNTTGSATANTNTSGTTDTSGKQSSTPGIVPAILSLFG